MHVQPKPLSRYPLLLRPLFWLQQRRYGQILTPSLLWARSPRLFFALSLFYGAIERRSSPLEPALRSLVLARVSQVNWCAFCIDINSATLIERSGSTERADRLHEWRECDLFTDRERVALEYCELMTERGSRIPEEFVDMLAHHFDDDAIVELTALIAFQNLSTKFNSALDIAPLGFCQVPARK